MMARREPSDWLSPVLVKEMRQGLKSRLFTMAFLVIQLAMLCSSVVILTMDGAREMRNTSAVLFWGFTVSMVVVLMPLMGLNALAVEIKDRTFELVLLTRLTAWRIVSGKWASLVGQIALVSSGLLPYLVLRYYLGGVDLLLELAILPLVLLVAAGLSAVTIYASTYGTALARMTVLGVQGVAFVFGLAFAGSLGRRGTLTSLGGVGLDALGWGVFIAALLVCMVILLQAAATRVAPPAENHAVVKRGLGLVLLVLSLAPMQADLQQAYVAALVPVLALVGIDACSEPISSAPTAYLPYARWRTGILNTLAYPGWPGGLAYTGLVGLLVGLRLALWDVLDLGEAALIFLGFFATVAVPVALSRLLGRGRRFVIGWALGFHLVMMTLATVAGQVADSMGGDRETALAAVSPLIGVVITAANELGGGQPVVLAATLTWLSLAALVLWRFGRDEVAEVARQEAVARGSAPP